MAKTDNKKYDPGVRYYDPVGTFGSDGKPKDHKVKGGSAVNPLFYQPYRDTTKSYQAIAPQSHERNHSLQSYDHTFHEKEQRVRSYRPMPEHQPVNPINLKSDPEDQEIWFSIRSFTYIYLKIKRSIKVWYRSFIGIFHAKIDS